MYERNAIIIERFFNSMFGYDIKNNIKTNFTNYCELIEALEKYKKVSEEEEEIIIEYDIIANRIRDIQRKQENLNKKNLQFQQERNELFQNIDEDANLIQNKLDSINNNIQSIDEEIKENAQNFTNVVAEFNEKSIIRTKCGKNRRMVEKDYNNKLNTTLDNYKNIDINLEKRAKQFIEIDTTDIEIDLKNKIQKNGENEKIPFKEKVIDQAVAEVIINLVRNPRFASLMQEKIDMKVDTSALEQEIATHEKQLRQYHATKSKLIDEIDSLDPDDKHYARRKTDLDERLYKMYDKIDDTESELITARAKKMSIEAEKLTGDNIYKILIYFDKLYSKMSDLEKRKMMEALISEIEVHKERQPNGQWLKSITFRLPIIKEDMILSLDNGSHVETVVKLVRRDSGEDRE